MDDFTSTYMAKKSNLNGSQVESNRLLDKLELSAAEEREIIEKTALHSYT